MTYCLVSNVIITLNYLHLDDYNRVVIKNRPNDYINASYIKDDYGRIKYIAAQGPIGELETSGGRRDSTVEDFWHMIWQEKVDCVVCLTQCTENLRQKCAMYWPEYADESVKIDEDLSMNLYCYTEDENCFQREIWLEKKGEGTRKVNHTVLIISIFLLCTVKLFI